MEKHETRKATKISVGRSEQKAASYYHQPLLAFHSHTRQNVIHSSEEAKGQDGRT